MKIGLLKTRQSSTSTIVQPVIMGRESMPIKGTRNGRWLGPFTTFSSAEKAARDTGRPVRLCKNVLLAEPWLIT